MYHFYHFTELLDRDKWRIRSNEGETCYGVSVVCWTYRIQGRFLGDWENSDGGGSYKSEGRKRTESYLPREEVPEKDWRDQTDHGKGPRGCRGTRRESSVEKGLREQW